MWQNCNQNPAIFGGYPPNFLNTLAEKTQATT